MTDGPARATKSWVTSADHADMPIDREIFPLSTQIDSVVQLFEQCSQHADAAALVFPRA